MEKKQKKESPLISGNKFICLSQLYKRFIY